MLIPQSRQPFVAVLPSRLRCSGTPLLLLIIYPRPGPRSTYTYIVNQLELYGLTTFSQHDFVIVWRFPLVSFNYMMDTYISVVELNHEAI